MKKTIRFLIFSLILLTTLALARTATFDGGTNLLWNVAANWDGPDTLPVAGDAVVIPNGFTVELDLAVTPNLLSITNVGTGTITADSAVVKTITATTITANGTVPLISLLGVASTEIIGNITNTSADTGDYTIHITSAVNVTFTGNLAGGTAGTTNYAVYNATTGGILVTGNVAGDNNIGLYLNGIQTSCIIMGNTTGGDTAGASGVHNQTSGPLDFRGSVTGGLNATAYGLYNTSTTAVIKAHEFVFTSATAVPHGGNCGILDVSILNLNGMTYKTNLSIYTKDRYSIYGD